MSTTPTGPVMTVIAPPIEDLAVTPAGQRWGITVARPTRTRGTVEFRLVPDAGAPVTPEGHAIVPLDLGDGVMCTELELETLISDVVPMAAEFVATGGDPSWYESMVAAVRIARGRADLDSAGVPADVVRVRQAREVAGVRASAGYIAYAHNRSKVAPGWVAEVDQGDASYLGLASAERGPFGERLELHAGTRVCADVTKEFKVLCGEAIFSEL